MGISVTGRGQRHGSLFVQLLPFIEQQNLYSNCNFTVPTQYYSYIASHPPIAGDTSLKGPPVTAQLIAVLKCPSDDPWTNVGGNPAYNNGPAGVNQLQPAGSNYAGSMGNESFDSGLFGENLFYPNGANGGSTGYIWHGHALATVAEAQAQGGVGSPGGKYYPTANDNAGPGAGLSGVFSHCDWSAGLNEIPDGTTNTIAIGEIRPLCGWHTRDGWMGDNSLWIATTAPINFATCPGDAFYVPATAGNEGDQQWVAKWDSSRPIRAGASSSSATARPISSTRRSTT